MQVPLFKQGICMVHALAAMSQRESLVRGSEEVGTNNINDEESVEFTRRKRMRYLM